MVSGKWFEDVNISQRESNWRVQISAKKKGLVGVCNNTVVMKRLVGGCVY